MKRNMVIVALLMGLQFLTLPVLASEQVLIDRVIESEAEELDIEIPSDVEPGRHVVEIEVSDDSGVISQRLLEFCKTEFGEILWEQACPGELIPYDPSRDAETTAGIVIAAFVLLSAISTSFGGARLLNERERTESEVEGSQSSLEAVDAGRLLGVDRVAGWGDRTLSWRAPFSEGANVGIAAFATRVSRFSPMLYRIATDAGYLRATIGSIHLILYPLALLVAVQNLEANKWTALPA